MKAGLSGASASRRSMRYVSGDMRRSRMPVRWVIHSSLVLMQRESSALVTTGSGTDMPVAVILARRVMCR